VTVGTGEGVPGIKAYICMAVLATGNIYDFSRFLNLNYLVL